MSEGLKVDFAEIDRMTNGLTELNTWALPLVPKVGAISADGDLLASAILSPGTAVAAESAVLTASVQLGVTVASTEALVVVTASIVQVYQTADEAIRLAAFSLQFAWQIEKSTLEKLNVIRQTLPGDLQKLAGVAGDALTGATVEAALAAAVAMKQGRSPSDIARASADGFWDGTADGLQAGLGDLGPGYAGVLSRLIWDGQVFGMFNDGDAKLGEPDGVSQSALRARGDSSYLDSLGATGHGSARDAEGKILPSNASQLFEGAAQIDAVGAKDLSDIRVLTMRMPDGSCRFTVQIPSTLNWSLWAGANPNDLTSDVVALDSGSSALSRASFAALDKAMAEAGAPRDSPVMVAGFSLGGITAAAMASDSNGYNVQQVVTAGAPVANFGIPKSTSVLSLEAHGDPIATLDGAPNPSRDTWNTIVQPPSHLVGEDANAVVSPIDRHNANRYSVMAQSSADDNAGVNWFLQGGTLSAEDYYATR